MSMPNGSDPIDGLRAADPVRAEDVPEASLARMTASVQEHIVPDIRIRPHRPTDPWPARHRRRAGPRRRLRTGRSRSGPRPRGGGARRPVAVVPSPTENPAAGGGGAASCLVYDPANLPTFDVVFDGTVTAIDGDQVTFDVNEASRAPGAASR